MKSIVFIVGSFREKSFNRQLATTCAKCIGDKVRVDFLDFQDVPFMNQDCETPSPVLVERVRKTVADCDGMWIFTPEYNGAVPGTLKNLLDWLSRPRIAGDFSSGTAVAGKKVTISGVGGKNATASSRADLEKLLTFMKMEVIGGTGTGFIADKNAFENDVFSLSDEGQTELEKQVQLFLSCL